MFALSQKGFRREGSYLLIAFMLLPRTGRAFERI